jgi:hypothetical protein
VEVGEAGFALDFVDAQLDFAEGVIFVLLEVGERDFEYSACGMRQLPISNSCVCLSRTLQAVACVLHTGRSIDESFADTAMN